MVGRVGDLFGLTAAECQVLQHLLDGDTADQAARLSISMMRRVRSSVYRELRK